MPADEEKLAPKQGTQPADSFDSFGKSHIAAIKARMISTSRITAADRDDLKALAALQTLSPPSIRPNRWIPVTLFLVTMLLTSILFFTHIRSARIDFQGDVSELSFTTLAAHDLPFPSELRFLALGGAESIDLSALEPLPAACRNVQSENLRLSVPGPARDQGSIGLAGLVVPAGSTVTVSHKESSSFASDVLVQPPPKSQDRVSANITGKGTVQAVVQGCKIDLKGPITPSILVDFKPGEQINVSTVGFEEAGLQDLEIPINQMDLFSVDANTELNRDERGSKSELKRSSILSGTLYFDSMPGITRTLRVEELLSFRDLHGMLRVVSVAKDHLTVRFTGTVNNLYTEEGDGNESLMPTCFEWLRSSHGFLALCASGLYLFGLVLGLAKWWGLKI